MWHFLRHWHKQKLLYAYYDRYGFDIYWDICVKCWNNCKRMELGYSHLNSKCTHEKDGKEYVYEG